MLFRSLTAHDVVVAVSKAGGFGVLGAVGFTPEQLEIELNWIDEHIGDHPASERLRVRRVGARPSTIW